MTFTKPVYPIREGFEVLHISPVTGYKLIKKGLLRTYTIGRNRYCTSDALRECIDALEVAPRQEAA